MLSFKSSLNRDGISELQALVQQDVVTVAQTAYAVNYCYDFYPCSLVLFLSFFFPETVVEFHCESVACSRCSLRVGIWFAAVCRKTYSGIGNVVRDRQCRFGSGTFLSELRWLYRWGRWSCRVYPWSFLPWTGFGELIHLRSNGCSDVDT